MATNKILVTGTSVRQDLLQPLSDNGYEIVNPPGLLSEDELKNELSNSVGYLLGGDEFASQVALSEADHLKVIAFLGMGYQSFIDVKAAMEKKIPVTNTPGTLSNSVAEFTVGLLLNATRKLFKYASAYNNKIIGSETKQHDLSNLQIGIVGLGGIGTRIAEILRFGFNSNVAYFSRTRKLEEEKRLNIAYLPLEELLKSVDALILMTSANSETIGMIGKRQIDLLKDHAIIINTARPEIIQAPALELGLTSGKLEYVAIDGFYEGDENGFKSLKAMIPDSLMITGHIASLTHEARDGMAIMAVNSILNILKSGSDLNIVN